MSSENIPWEYHAWDLKNHLIETGKLKIDLNRFADALIDLDKAIDVYPKDSIIFIENGKSKESNEDFIGAILSEGIISPGFANIAPGKTGRIIGSENAPMRPDQPVGRAATTSKLFT